MRSRSLPLAFALLAAAVAAAALAHAEPPPQPTPPPLPATPVREVRDTYFSKTIADPYRWLEDTKSPEVVAWLKAQDDRARAILHAAPSRDQLLARLHQLSDAQPFVYGLTLRQKRVFYLKLEPGQQNARLYVREGFSGAERLLFDPDKFGDAAHHASIGSYNPSYDGKKVIVSLALGGSEESELRVFDVDSGRAIDAPIPRARFAGPDWLPDDRSFFYGQLKVPAADEPPATRFDRMRVRLHRLGTPLDKDPAVFGADVTPALGISDKSFPFLSTSLRSPFVVASVSNGVSPEHDVFVARRADLVAGKLEWKRVAAVSDAVVDFDFTGDQIYLSTHRSSPRYEVVRTSLSAPDLAKAVSVVAPSERVIRGIVLAPDALYVRELDGGLTRIRRVDPRTLVARDLALPGDGTYLLHTNPSRPELLLVGTSWVQSAIIYHYDPKSGHLVDTKLQPPFPMDLTAFESHEVKVTAEDGTQVPLSIVHKRGLALDGSNPTLLTAYGSYGATQEPSFSARLMAWLERGGVYAVAHVRGGGEYGEDWHQAGRLLKKANTINDFIASARYLIAQRYTTAEHLGGMGTSAGGLTIGGAITAHPELFAAAVDRVGLADTLRFEQSEGGPANTHEFGSVATEEGFRALAAMSPYLQVRDKTRYPAVLLTGGINDHRVPVWQPAKMAARLQAATIGPRPIVLRLEYDAGHGIGSTKLQTDEEMADTYAFLFWQLGRASVHASK